MLNLINSNENNNKILNLKLEDPNLTRNIKIDKNNNYPARSQL